MAAGHASGQLAVWHHAQRVDRRAADTPATGRSAAGRGGGCRDHGRGCQRSARGAGDRGGAPSAARGAAPGGVAGAGGGPVLQGGRRSAGRACGDTDQPAGARPRGAGHGAGLSLDAGGLQGASMTPEYEQMMAYVDGELDAGARAQFERAMATDPVLARSVAAQRALRARLLVSLDRRLAEPVPERLLQTARTAPAGAAPVATLSLWRDRGRSQPQAPRFWALPAALGARLLLNGGPSGALWGTPRWGGLALQNGQLLARCSVAQALSPAL